jgi:carboxyl-terminal processing protease
MTSYYKEASMSGLILQYAFNYSDENRQRLADMTSVKEMETYLKKQNVVDKFAAYAEKNGLKRRNLMIQKSHKLLERFLVSRIIYNIHSEQAWSEYLNQDDPAIIEALRLFRENAAFPQKPQAPASDKKVAHA